MVVLSINMDSDQVIDKNSSSSPVFVCILVHWQNYYCLFIRFFFFVFLKFPHVEKLDTSSLIEEY